MINDHYQVLVRPSYAVPSSCNPQTHVYNVFIGQLIIRLCPEPVVGSLDKKCDSKTQFSVEYCSRPLGDTSAAWMQ